jgi:fimbrial chaperone protein
MPSFHDDAAVVRRQSILRRPSSMRAARLLSCLASALSWLPCAHAYSVTPSLVALRPTGSDSSAFLHLENRDGTARALEIVVREHHKDIDGQPLDGREVDDDFLVFPSQMVLLPGDEVGVQLRWIGEPRPAVERTFVVLTREVAIPEKTSAEAAPAEGIRIAVTVLMNYEVKVYVTPPGAKPDVVVESVTVRPATAGASAGRDAIEIILANRGAAHAVLTERSLVLSGAPANGAAGRSVTLSARSIPALRPHLLAGEKRRVVVPRPPELPEGDVRVTWSR